MLTQDAGARAGHDAQAGCAVGFDEALRLVLERGRVAESGTHAQLLTRAGLYRRMVAAYEGVA